MRYLLVPAALLALFAAATGGHAAAAYSCKLGDRVTDRQNRTGTVSEIQSNGTYCYVDLDSGEKRQYYIAWMLKSAGAAAQAAQGMASVRPGRYECWMRAGGNMNYMGMDVNIRDASNYTDKGGAAGSYSYDPGSNVITFRSGPQSGSYAKLLEPGKIGISSQQTTIFNVVCDLKP